MGATIEGKRYKYQVGFSAEVEGENLKPEEAITALQYALMDFHGDAEPTVSVGQKAGVKVRIDNLHVRRQVYTDDNTIAAYPDF